MTTSATKSDRAIYNRLIGHRRKEILKQREKESTWSEESNGLRIAFDRDAVKTAFPVIYKNCLEDLDTVAAPAEVLKNVHDFRVVKDSVLFVDRVIELILRDAARAFRDKQSVLAVRKIETANILWMIVNFLRKCVSTAYTAYMSAVDKEEKETGQELVEHAHIKSSCTQMNASSTFMSNRTLYHNLIESYPERLETGKRRVEQLKAEERRRNMWKTGKDHIGHDASDRGGDK